MEITTRICLDPQQFVRSYLLLKFCKMYYFTLDFLDYSKHFLLVNSHHLLREYAKMLWSCLICSNLYRAEKITRDCLYKLSDLSTFWMKTSNQIIAAFFSFNQSKVYMFSYPYSTGGRLNHHDDFPIGSYLKSFSD